MIITLLIGEKDGKKDYQKIMFLKKNKPIIFIEIAPYLYPEFGYSCQELIKFIQKLDYRFLDENIKEVSNIFDQINKIKDGGSKNFFLV